MMLLICFTLAGCSHKEEGVSAAVGTGKDTTNKAATENAISEKAVSYRCDMGSISLYLPDGWSHKIEKYKETKEDKTFGITFWQDKTKKNKISVQYTEQFGVCGTGLEIKDIQLNKINCEAGYYDGKPYWSYIYVKEPENFVVLNFGENKNWWTTNGDQVMKILDTLTLEAAK